MASTSLRGRIFRGVAAVGIATIALMSAAIFFAYEDMERSMLHLVFADEEAFFLSHLDTHGNHLETATLDALFVPAGASTPVPALFAKLPVPYSGELHRGEKSYLVHIDRVQGGTLYLAKDVTLFERRETLFRVVLGAAVLLTLAIGVVLAHFTAARIARPLARLAAAVDGLVPGGGRKDNDRFPTEFEEAELRRIAVPFARYLDELDALMTRERRLLSLASHELRTPVAAISGALDVIEKHAGNGNGTERHERALQRIRVAADEMRAQIDAILALSRARSAETPVVTRMDELCVGVIDDLAAAGLSVRRIDLTPPFAPVAVATHPVLAKMLVRNLLHNALQHTTGEVSLELAAAGLSIADTGAGLPAAYRSLIDHPSVTRSAPPEGGLGLYLVTLIAERLGWRLTIDAPSSGGTRVSVGW
jgi:signal transduction histidine kinase